MNIQCYSDFTAALLSAGFSMGGGNDEGIFAVIPWGWNADAPYETPVRWHTGDRDTDPWEWRMRVLDEEGDIAYGKVFFKKSGFITREFYPHFLAARRCGRSFDRAYADGEISHAAKRIYEVVCAHGAVPLHLLKQEAGFSKEDGSQFDRGLVELQMQLYLTMCGRRQKLSQRGKEYGWSSTVFCTVEQFFGAEITEHAAAISAPDAVAAITARVLALNPNAQAKKIAKFILAHA